MMETSNRLFKINNNYLTWFDHCFKMEMTGCVGLVNKLESVGIPCSVENPMEGYLKSPSAMDSCTRIKQMLTDLHVSANHDMTQFISMLYKTKLVVVVFVSGEVPHILMVRGGAITPLSLTSFGAVEISERREYEYVFTDQHTFSRLKPYPFLI